MPTVILATGSYLPETALSNDDIERTAADFDRTRAGMSLDEWAVQHLGVRCRHRIRPGEGTSEMGAQAARRALEGAGLGPEDLDLIVMSTFTSDYWFPHSAGQVQALLDAGCKFYQIEHGGAGFVDAVLLASALMGALGAETALALSAEAVSVYCDPLRFLPQTVFGDGAGAAILGRSPDPSRGVQACVTGGDGRLGPWMAVPGPGSKRPPGPELLERREHYLRAQFRELYPFAVRKMAECIREVVAQAGKTPGEVDWILPHQGGRRMIADLACELGLPAEKFLLFNEDTADTAGASVAIALDRANRAGLLRDGDALVLASGGAGLEWSALYLNWYNAPLARAND